MGELTREEKIKIFEENKKLIDSIAYKKYRAFIPNGHYDDIIQEGYVKLWNLIDEKGIKCESQEERIYTYNMVWGSMGGYVERKVKLDKRVKKNKDVSFISIYQSNGEKDNALLYEVLPCETNIEKYVTNKDEAERLLEFAENVDKYSFKGKKQFRKILEMSMENISQNIIADEIERTQNIVSRRLKMISQIIQDTFYNERICSI